MPVVGYLANGAGVNAYNIGAFRKGLSEMGFVEGGNVAFDIRVTDQYDRFPALARELVERKIAAIFAFSITAASAAKAATATIPIVFSGAGDPVKLGLVTSLNRPGGNVTGMSLFTSDMIGKMAQLLKEMVPGAAAIAYLINPSSPSEEIYAREAPVVASGLGLRIAVLNASTEHDLDDAFASLGKTGVDALVVPPEPFFDSQRDRIVALAARYAVPMIAGLREYVVAGGLMSYGASLPDSYRRASIYVGRVLRGEKPADLPVMQPTKFDLVLNLKTAKALGLAVPDRLLALADEVIE
jgi:putative ABC transport system substrate-binding protein